jgi:predicted PurR-regulated permease PerM
MLLEAIMKFYVNKRWISIFLLAIAVIIAYKIINNVEVLVSWFLAALGMLSPFFAGFGIAYILYIPCRKLKNQIEKSKYKFLQKRAGVLSVLGVYLILFGVVALALSLLIPALSTSIVQLAGSLPSYYNQIVAFLQERFDVHQVLDNISIHDVVSQLSSMNLSVYAEGLFGFFRGMLNVVLAVISSIYMLLDQERILSIAKRILTATTKGVVESKIRGYAKKINEIFLKFLYSQFLDAVIIWILSSIVLFVIRAEYWLLLGFIIGLFNMIPYFGSIFSGLLAAVITGFTSGRVEQGVIVAVALLILQQIDGNIIGPRIVGGSLNIRPLVIVIAIAIGGKLFGVLGMFLAVPVAAILRIIVIEYFELLEAKKEEAKGDRKSVV